MQPSHGEGRHNGIADTEVYSWRLGNRSITDYERSATRAIPPLTGHIVWWACTADALMKLTRRLFQSLLAGQNYPRCPGELDKESLRSRSSWTQAEIRLQKRGSPNARRRFLNHLPL